MNNLFTLKTFTYTHDAEIAKGVLEAEGIQAFVLDGLTVQINPLYSDAVGGVKLQVREADIGEAIQIMEKAGYEIELEDDGPLFPRLDTMTRNLPLIGAWQFEIRILVIAAVVASVLLGLVYLLGL